MSAELSIVKESNTAAVDSPPRNWLISATPDPQMVNSEWEQISQQPIEGVVVKQVKHVVTNNGFLTELYRSDWNLDAYPVDQVFSRVLEPLQLSAWHCHAVTTDRLFCLHGRMLIALYDGRSDSPTARRLMTFRVGSERPTLLIVPPGVWHGLKNLSSSPSILINMVNEAYDYEAPDHWRLPWNSPQIPFDFAALK